MSLLDVNRGVESQMTFNSHGIYFYLYKTYKDVEKQLIRILIMQSFAAKLEILSEFFSIIMDISDCQIKLLLSY